MEPEHMNIIDDYHGTKVKDSFRWLETQSHPETVAWVKEENRLTLEYFDNLPVRNELKKRLARLFRYESFSCPEKIGSYYFFSGNDGISPQPRFFRQDITSGEVATVIDPSEFSKDGTVTVRKTSYSPDGALVAYSLSTEGREWQEIRIRDVNSGKDYDEVLHRFRGGGIAWKHDRSGFYYSRYPATEDEKEECKGARLYWHRTGTEQSEDRLVYDRPEEKEIFYSPSMSDDGKYLILKGFKRSQFKNSIYYREAEKDGDFIPVIKEDLDMFVFIDNTDGVFYFHSDRKAPRGRVVAIDINNSDEENWKEIIPECEDVIDYVKIVYNHIVVFYNQHATTGIKIYNLNGNFIKEIKLPCTGSVEIYERNSKSGLISGNRKDNEMFFAFRSYLYPTTVFSYDFRTESLKEFKKINFNLSLEDYETKQIFYTSKDGTKVPMFITHKKCINLDGNNPVILLGYGGYGIRISPSFSPSIPVWLEHGGIYAVACLRGGGEYGKEWHRAGMLEKKQNTFDDFISAAEWFIENKYSRKKKIGIIGISNGGLLVSACMVQRPDLFGAVVCQVPIIDMLRFHKTKMGYLWIPEHGNPDNPEDFKYLYSYSPVHNIKEGVIYPPVFVSTSENDELAPPFHAEKFVATLKAKSVRGNSILLWVEPKAGHDNERKSLERTIENSANTYAFFIQELGMDYI